MGDWIPTYEAFGEMPYLVGSVELGGAWRDVDVRIMLKSDDPLLSDKHRCLALNVALSAWGRRATDLPIDFQFQDIDEANAEFGGLVRNPIGIHGRDRHPPERGEV
jgi:hypothetical protein